MRVFYSWQSDTPGKTGHYLVRDALQTAIEELASDMALEEAERPELDHDTKGLSGAPAIAEAILAKVDACDVFVADVSIVGATQSEKPLINSNVAIELGYALKARGYEALVMVMNIAHGSPEQLPFDLRHRRWPLRYSLPADADKKACDEARKELTSSLKPILREYLTKDRSAVSVRPFVEAPSTISPAHYFSPDEELVPPDTERGWNGLRCSRKSILYVRMHPKLFVAELPERKAATLLWENRVGPFRAGSGYSDARNQYGGIVYSADRDAGEILSATQLFRSREVWGVDISLLTWTTTARPTEEEVPCIPSQSYEKIIADGLRGNLSFARDVLDYSLPVVVEAGASNIAGFYMGMGSKYLNPLWGPVHREHIQKRCELTSWDEDAVNDVLLAIFEEFFDAVGAPRPEQLNGFPPSSETGKVKA